jgi:ATP-dependent protease ClpP protease subunit
MKIFLTGEIGGWGVNSEDISYQISQVPEGENIELFIDSPGGSVLEANSIMNQLMMAKNNHKVIGKVVGQCMSAATYILQACDERYLASNSIFMIHEVSINANGRMTENKMREMADIAKVFNESVLTSLASSGLDAEEIRAKYFDGKDHFMNAQEAIDAGFADSILDFSLETSDKSLALAGDVEARFSILNQYYDMSKKEDNIEKVEVIDQIEKTDEPTAVKADDSLLASFKSRMEEAQSQRDDFENLVTEKEQALTELQAKYDTLATDFQNSTSKAEKAKVEASFEIQNLKEVAAKDKQVYEVKAVIMNAFARANVRKTDDEINRYASAFLAQHKLQDQNGTYAVMDIVENVVSDLSFDACVMQFVERNYKPARGNGFKTSNKPSMSPSAFAAADKQNKVDAWAAALSAKRIPFGSRAAYQLAEREFGLTKEDLA